jgi:S-adenosylmethionine-diacylglycerol 3-amino-3-carboxypropyl transferase
LQTETRSSEAARHAEFSQIRYAQCWEDADILLAALDPQPGHVLLSIASAGDNALALLTRNPARVIAVDLNPAQLACLELRVAAYRELEHEELLQLIGSRPSQHRAALYRRCRQQLSAPTRDFWDGQPALIEQGIGSAGKFERFFALFRNRVLPLIHSRRRVLQLMAGGSREERIRFYEEKWNTWRWRLLFRLFFSRLVMGKLGRDPSFFRYVQGSVADRILTRSRYALTELNPADNPYLQWILTGQHPHALPLALRPEHFDVIRRNLDRLEWRLQPLEEYNGPALDGCNLSDIFEYTSEEHTAWLLGRLLERCRPGARLAYWNTLVPRSRPETLKDRLIPLSELAEKLFLQDKAFFYARFVVEEVIR